MEDGSGGGRWVEERAQGHYKVKLLLKRRELIKELN